MATKREVIKDEADAEQRQQDAKSEAGLEGQAQDSKRYRYLRDRVRVGGVINERIYVRCDGRYNGEWALDGEQLDNVLDALLLNVPDAPEEAPAKAA